MTSGKRTWVGTLGILIVGALIGIAGLALTNEMVHATSNNEFCGTACHSMQWAYAAYQRGPHAKSHTGVTAGCGDCHIPYESQEASSLQYLQLLAHKAKAGAIDAYHQMLGTIDTEQKWQKERDHLSGNVKAWMTANNSLTCRGCHDLSKMANSAKPAVAEMHAPLLKAESVVCIECHTNAGHVYDQPK